MQKINSFLISFIYIFCCLSLLLVNSMRNVDFAHAWEVELHENPYLPETTIAVSKTDQNLIIIDNKEGFKIDKAFASIHGEIQGDKFLEGDLKTPEGVYFVTTKIKSKLDFEKYGSGAYVLNYPNPIDIIRQKTGHGIWIHSKGNPILGQVTEGCVAVDLQDLDILGDYLPKGRAVVIAEYIKRPAELESAFLDVPKQYKKESIINAEVELEENEEIIFSTALSDDLNNENPIPLSANIEEEFIELKPKARTLAYFTIKTAKALAGTLPVEEADTTLVLDENNFEQSENLLAYNSSSEDDVLLKSALIAQEAKQENNVNEEISTLQDSDFEVQENRYTEQSTTEISSQKQEDTIEQNDETFSAEWFVEETKAWNEAWQNKSESFFDFYDSTKYGLAQNQSFKEFVEQKKSLFTWLPWIQIVHGDIYAAEGNGYWVTWFEQLYRAPNTSSEGTRRLYWQKDKSGVYKIVAMEWIPSKIGLEDMYMASIQPEIEAIVENWKNSWLNADIEKYKTFYTSNAIQGSRKGDEIFIQKTELWSVKKPKSLVFDSLKIIPQGNKILVSMNQTYEDMTGYKDYGVKDIYFVLENETWRIEQEDWRKKRK